MTPPSTLEGHRPQILVVDDSASHLRLMEFLLASEKHDVVAIDNVRDALEFLKSNTPDLIVLDIEMPGLTGLDLSGRIKMIPRLAGVPVVLVTSLRDGRLQDERAFVGAERVLEKPLRGDEFRSEVNRHLELPLPLSQQPHVRAGGSFVSKY